MPAQAPPPKISVVVPAYNAGRYIGECLASISAQNGPFETEIIVVDDGSRDDTIAQVQAFGGVRLFSQANAGPSAARNRGIAAAAGEYVAFLDSDDLWTPGKLAAQMEIMTARPEVGLVFGDCQRFDEDGGRSPSLFSESGLDAAFFGDPVLVEDAYVKLFRLNYIPTGAVLLRKACFETAGLFDEGMRYVEDLDMWLRVAFHFPVAYTPHLCQLKRQHGENVSNNAEVMTLAHIRVLERQRELHGDLLKSRGVRLQSRFSLEYCGLGWRCEREGRLREARRWYLRGLLAHPAPRPLYYLLRTLLPGQTRQ